MKSAETNTPPNQPEYREDLAIIGGGLSGSLLLRTVLSHLGSKPIDDKYPPIKISVFDQEGNFGGGLAFGSKIGRGALFATPLSDFTDDETERTLLRDFLIRRKDDWTKLLRDDPYGNAWLEKNEAQIKLDHYDSLYLPRFILGIFLQELLTGAIKAAEASGIATVELRRNSVRSIDKSADHLVLRYAEGEEILELKARHAVLASGFPEPQKSSGPLVDFHVSDIYTPSLPATLNLIKDCARRKSPELINILIRGSNAACLELLYHIRLNPEILAGISRITVLSPSGVFPDEIRPDGRSFASFPELERMHRLGDPYSAEDVVIAAKADVKRARQLGFVASEFCGPLVTKGVLPLLDRLPLPEQRDFVERHGSALVAMFRRAGPEYISAVEFLMQSGKLEIVAGRLSRINVHPNKLEATIECDANSGDRLDPETRFQFIANCAGFPAVGESSSSLLHNICNESNLRIKINGSGRGLEVDDQYRASENLYIVGELLTGITNATDRLWHVESSARIYGLATKLGAILSDKLVGVGPHLGEGLLLGS